MRRPGDRVLPKHRRTERDRPDDPPGRIGLQAVLFDLDGTLIDTEPFWLVAECELVDELGGSWSDAQAAQLVGGALVDTGRALLRATGRQEIDPAWVVGRLLDAVVRQVRACEPMPWRPGAVELLDSLRDRGIPCALVSASYRRLMQVTIDRLPKGSFAVSVAGDEVNTGKPHPEPYLRACTRLGVRADDCIVIEDSVNGAASGNAAGALVLAVPSGAPLPGADRRAHVESLRGIDADWLVDLFRHRAD